MPNSLVGNASTQSRSKRPLPPGAVRAETLEVFGPHERTRFYYADGHSELKLLLSWIGGQAGLLWGGGPFPPEIQAAITRYGGDVHGSYGHTHERQLADALGEALAGAFTSDDIACRFGLSGRDALDAAARVARAATGRDFVASYGYHGAGESWVHPPYPEGVPRQYQDLSWRFEWGYVDNMRAVACESAAVCVEVPPLPDEEIVPFLNACRQACDEFGAVFILDEVVSGFRFGLGGAAARYGVKPDIACYGKAMSALGGVSAIIGRRDLLELLDGRTFFSLTFGGRPSDCAVATATVNWLMGNPEAYSYLAEIGHALKDGLNEIGVKVVGQPERSVMEFETKEKLISFCSQMIGLGIMVHKPQFPTLVHTLRDVEKTIEIASRIIQNETI